MSCLSEDTMLSFVVGELAGDKLAAAEAHIDVCSDCRRLLYELAKQTLAGSRAVSPSHALTVPQAPRARSAADAPVRAGPAAPSGYALDREIARGGMGRVVAATDLRLGRPVAVKQLLAERPDLRARFEREVRLTARLQHPAIVPVYEAGELADGEPYYAMRLVAGRPLDKVIEATAEDDRLALLPNILTVAEALAYAHGQRVIHRDLKPANILVGEFGETVVIDWGLAKALGETDPVSAPGGAASDDQTVAGAVLGTPGYMAPEQARGEEVDARADVWALGAILYHVLSGRPPYGGVAARDALERSRAGRVVPLRERRGDLSRDLVAIVERAMAPAAADRYPSARELAEDLKAFQTGQLVGAHRYTLWQLWRRWLGRHRAAVAIAAVAAALLAATAVVSVRRVIGERDRADTQRAAAEELVDFMISDLRGRLEGVGRLELLEGIGDRVDAYYVAIAGGEAQSLQRRAWALQFRGDVALSRGDLDGARAAYQASFELLGQLAGRQPEAGTAELAGAWDKLGDVALRQGRSAEALAAYRTALELREGLAARQPGDPVRRRAVAVSQTRLGGYHLASGDAAAALAAFEAARAELDRPDRPLDEEGERDLVRVYGGLGDAHQRGGRGEEALAAQRRALAFAQALADRHPDDVQATRSLAVAQERIGDLELARGGHAAAAAAYRASLAAAQRLADHDPSNAGWQRDLAVSWQKIGDLEAARGHLPAARDAYAEDVAISERLAAAHPDHAQWQNDLAGSYGRVAAVDAERGEPAAALALLEKELAVREALAARDPANHAWQAHLAAASFRTGQVLAALGRTAEARAAFERARGRLAPLPRAGLPAELRELPAEIDRELAALPR